MPKSIIVPAARKVKPGYDPRGKISCGFKNAKGFPQSTDFFRVDPFEEIVKVCGKKPTKLLIYFPPCIDGNYSDWFFFSYNEWSRNAQGVGKLKVKCDRAVYNVGYRVMIDGVWKEEKTDYPCRRKEDGTGCDCKCNVTFGAWVADPFTPPYRPLHHLPIKFTTGSDSNGQKLLTWLELRKNDLLGLPFVLSVHMGFNGTNKFPVWTVTPMEHSNSAIKGELTGIGALQIENKAVTPTSGVAQLTEGGNERSEVKLFNDIITKIEKLTSIDGKDGYTALVNKIKADAFPFSDEHKQRINADLTAKRIEILESVTVGNLIDPVPESKDKHRLIRDGIKENLEKNNHLT